MRETIDTYNNITKPQFIDTIDHKKANGWMYNALDGIKEVEQQLYIDDSFMLSKDWEFNEGDLETLYCLAMVKQRDPALMTVRDLNGSHLKLLKHIRDKSTETIATKYGIHKS